jgi:hypothetical protein
MGVSRMTLSRKIILEKCKNCERAFNEYGKLCHWRIFEKNYCFDGLSDEEANKEINKHFDYFQTQIARGLVSKELPQSDQLIRN